jgi:hypothetical protein
MYASHLVVVIAGLAGQPPTQPPFFKEYAKAATFYYKSPDPALGPRMLKALLQKENLEHPWFATNGHVLNLIAGQLADIAAGRPQIVREYEAAFAGAPTAGRRIIIRCLMDCGDRETVRRADAWLADRRYADIGLELAALKKHLEDPGRKHARDRRARTPDDLDRLWSTFFITGQYAPVARILDVFDSRDGQDPVVLKRVALWSLGSNLQQHPKLMGLVREHAKERPEASRKVVEELIRTVEELPGRWLSQDGDQQPLLFGPDGSFQCGFVKEKGNWVMARGAYAIMPDGKIATRAEHQGSTLFQTFTFKDGVLTGSRGPNPRVEWWKQRPGGKKGNGGAAAPPRGCGGSRKPNPELQRVGPAGLACMIGSLLGQARRQTRAPGDGIYRGSLLLAPWLVCLAWGVLQPHSQGLRRQQS